MICINLQIGLPYLTSEAFELNTNWQAPLQLCQHVTRFTRMEGTTANEKDMIRVHITILG